MKRVTSAAALLSACWFFVEVIPRSWSNPSSDFPNYYTAALLTRTHQPLRLFYEWVWFQRQIDRAGFDGQLGGYIPQTPVTMAPFVPLSLFSPLAARRIWLILNLSFLMGSLALIARMTRFSFGALWLLSVTGYYALRSNLELGQYYLFLLALLTLAVYLLVRRREIGGGMVLGAAIALKLYGAPFLLMALSQRRRPLAGAILASFSLFCIVAIAVFGWSDIVFFALNVLPRALSGETLNPWHPSNGTAATLLRRLFLREPELNPRPVADLPAAFFFPRCFFTLGVVLFPMIAAAGRAELRASERTLSWWLIGSLLVSPNTASYTFVLLILPIALMLDSLPKRTWPLVIGAWFLLTVPLRQPWSFAFPRLWLLLALFLIAGYPELKLISSRNSGLAFAAIALVSAVLTTAEMREYNREPENVFTRAVNEPGAIYASSPAVSSAGELTYEAIGPERYVLRRGAETLTFHGDAFHPSVAAQGGPIYFELAHGRESKIMRLDPQTRETETMKLGVPNPSEPAVSPDGKKLAFVSDDTLYLYDGRGSRPVASPAHDAAFTSDGQIVFVGTTGAVQVANIATWKINTLLISASHLATPSISPDGQFLIFAARREANWHVWVRNLKTGAARRVTAGNCNSSHPVWSGMRSIFFSSDCGRGLGLPALYRASLDGLFQ